MFSPLRWVLLLSLILLAGFMSGCDTGQVRPNLTTARAKAEQCVEPTVDMRRNHMVYLDVHRDATVLKGIRTQQHSLNECINCHIAATRADGKALHYPDKEHFCASCHRYVGVKIDCFQCHADRPQVMDTPDYPHKLGMSAHTDHRLSAAMATPDIADLLLVTGRGLRNGR